MFIDIGISNRHSENSVEDLPKIELTQAAKYFHFLISVAFV